MPSIKEWKQTSEELLSDIDKYEKSPKALNPYKVFSTLAKSMLVVAGIVLPQTQAVKWILAGIRLGGEFLKRFSEKRK